MSDVEAPSFSTDPELRKAAKVHKCCECHNDIVVGEKHWYFKGVWDKTFQTFRVCTPCEEQRYETIECLELAEQAEYWPHFGGLRAAYEEYCNDNW